ncbi:undecaprenyl diphosphate synthase family protein [Streptomyces sp. NPDC059928]|uniref:undecaprenyl diphosphate synthase family protein n=1 Tax=unclassified Streptomyces TaxID=2593676 RepID=UPI003657D013
MPRPVAIVMDGNGRWATAHGLPRTDGHRQGARAFIDVVHGALEIGLKYLTVYAFSTENWKRPADELPSLAVHLRRVAVPRHPLADVDRRTPWHAIEQCAHRTRRYGSVPRIPAQHAPESGQEPATT